MDILLIEPYFTGSHRQWASGYQANSGHDVEILKLSGANWKWRMHGGAVTLARRFLDSGSAPDLILATDMLDLTTFLALTRRKTSNIPTAIYFHENQLTYPWSPTDRDVVRNRDKHYGFINYASAMAADAVLFNSRYHMDSFYDEAVRLLKHFPDHNETGSIDALRGKSSVLPLGMDLRRLDEYAGAAASAGEAGAPISEADGPLVVWNHRWEYDKNPDEFFKALRTLADEDVPFRLAVLGENFSQVPVVFLKARDRLGDRVVQFGYAEDFKAYAHWLHSADVLPVTSHQDFFGAGVAEAIYCGCRPLLPRRLAYPELLPDETTSGAFYSNYNEFLDRLRALLLKPEPSGGGYRDAIARFEWQNMAPDYDRALNDVANNAL